MVMIFLDEFVLPLSFDTVIITRRAKMPVCLTGCMKFFGFLLGTIIGQYLHARTVPSEAKKALF